MTPVRGRLRKTWQRVSSEPKLGRNVLALLIVMVLGVGTTGYIVANQGSGTSSWPWEDRFVFQAEFTRAPAVSPSNGQEVRVAGVPVGEIESASVNKNGNAVLTLSIDEGRKIYRNARTVLRPKSPLNEMYVEIDPGGPPSDPIDRGGTIPASQSQRPVQVDEVLAHLDTNTRAALGSLLTESDTALAHAPEALPRGLSATDQLVRNLKPVAEQLRARKDKLASLVTSLAQISQAVGGNHDRLAGLAKSLQQTLQTAGNNSEQVDAALGQLPDLTRKLEQATSSVKGLSSELDPVLDNLRKASGTLPESLRKLTGTVDQVGRTVDQAKPVVNKARPVVDDLRPLVGDVNAALPHVRNMTSRLDRVTSAALPYLNDLQAFVYQTNSVTSMYDANGGILRGLLEFTPSSLPIKGTGALSGQSQN